MSNGRIRARRAGPAELRSRQVAKELGHEGSGKFVALDRKTGAYVTANDLDALIAAVLKNRPAKQSGDFHVFRVGHRAAIELRLRR